MLTFRRIVNAGARRAAARAGLGLVPLREGPLDRLRAAGVEPRTVLDVGAALGDWSLGCAAVYPDARYLLVEPLSEFHDRLRAVAASLGTAEVVAAAAGAAGGERTFNVHRDLVGSSLLREEEGSAVDGVPRTVGVATIDELVAERDLPGPFLLKVDVQGAELQVIEGARRTLEQAAAVQLEVSFFPFFTGGPTFADVVATLAASGFVAYDIVGLSYRPLDGALAQADVVFVPEHSPARHDHAYASPEQRRAQDSELAAAIGRRLKTRPPA